MKKHIYYVDAIVEVPIVLKVIGVDEHEAFGNVTDGSWQGVMRPDWDRAKVKSVGEFTKGPGINS